jgi:hypothetical protein
MKKQIMMIIDECMNEIYINSIPPASWNDIKETYDINDGKFWMKYKIPEQIYEDIRMKYLKKLSLSDRTMLDFFLNRYAPAFMDKQYIGDKD